MPRRARCGSPLTCCLRREEISQGLVEHLTAALPELAAGDDELREEMLSREANIDQVLRLLRAGADADALVVPIEVAQYVRGLVRRGVTLPVLLLLSPRARVVLGSLVAGAARPHRQPRGSPRGAGAELGVHVRLRGPDLRHPRGGVRQRARANGTRRCAAARRHVRSILAGEPIDEELAVQRLGYELRRHVALRVSSSASEVRGLERAARGRRPHWDRVSRS